MLIDDHECIMQSYLPYARGIDNPVFLMNNSRGCTYLYGVYQDIFQHVWREAEEFHGQ